MSYAERCAALEDSVRAKCPRGWQKSRAWVGMHFADPETDAERDALALVLERFPHLISVHAYDVVELVAELIQREADDHSAQASSKH